MNEVLRHDEDIFKPIPLVIVSRKHQIAPRPREEILTKRVQGLDSQTLATRDAQDIALINATNFVPFDKTDPKNDIYVVDFEGCLSAFL